MTKTKRIKRIIVSVTAVIMLAVTLMSFDPVTTTGDAASLKYIDEIVAESGTFNILEIVPDTAAASFGYYIDGQEPISSADFDTFLDGTVPINGWRATLAKKTSPTERTAFVNNLFSSLASKGVLGNSATTPLLATYFDGLNYYTEAYFVSNDDVQNWRQINLQTAESVLMTGTFAPAENGAGDMRTEYTYTPAADGGYVQNILYFNYTTDPVGTDTYYYTPTFLPIEQGVDLTGWDNVAVYTIPKDIDGNDLKDINGKPIYTVGQYKTVIEILNNGAFDYSQTYYYVDPAQTGVPDSFSSTNYYAAVVAKTDNDDAPLDGYSAPAVTGTPPVSGLSYFSRSISGYTYVGTGGNAAYINTGSASYTVKFNGIYYKAGFENNNLFKQYVLGLDSSTYNALNVTVTVRKASLVKAADISAAGMIYISSGTDMTSSGVPTSYTAEDIPDACAVELYNFAANQNPVIIDDAIIQGITATTPADQINNIEKLCLLSLQTGIAPTTQISLSGLPVDWTKLDYMESDADKTFVNNNVYCFNAFNTVSTLNIPNSVSPGPNDIITLVSALYNQSFTSNVYSSGFSAVLSEIQNENFLKQIAGQTALLPENVTVSASVRHIINFKGQRQTNPKTTIRVLDLEPAKVTSASSSYLTASTVRGWINNTLPEDEITIVHMTTGEFIGKIEDINETYDMIYIGMSTESMNNTGGNTLYNDPDMNGLIYSNIGDLYNASLELAGIRSQDYVYVNGTKAINGVNGSTANQFRFSGNDITSTKVSALKKYAQAGYPIVLADGFVSGSAINTAKVDSSSYMYTAMSNIYGAYANVMTQSYVGNNANADTVIKYLNVSKPTMNITTRPVEYADDSNASIAVAPNDGYYYLEYVFSISNVTDATPVSTRYDCRLYIDLNADGRYSENEGLNDIEVRRVADNALVLPLRDIAGKEYYALAADLEYRVTRQMPDSYAGIIPWKLEVVKNGADQIHASAQGYTRIASGSKVQTIKVLQIMQAGTSGTKLNLAQQLVVNPSGTNLQLKGKDGKFYTGIYGKLIADLADFHVTISTVETSALEATGNSAAILNYLNTYDMVIIGFNDCYDGIQVNSAKAIVDYIKSGKSVLFTHDTTSLSQVPAYNFPMAISGSTQELTLSSSKILYNTTASTYQNVQSSNPNVFWYDTISGAMPPKITSANYQYAVFMTGMPSGSAETDYFARKAGSSGDYRIYRITGDTYTQITSSVTSSTSLATFKSNNSITTPILYVYCSSAGGTYTNPNGNLTTSNQNIQATYNITKFVSDVKYRLNSYSYDYDVGYNGGSSVSTSSYTAHLLCLFKSTVTNYAYSGTYNSVSNTYTIGSATWYPATGAPFPQSTLFSNDPAVETPYTLSTIPSGITDWGYFFNTVIRDAVGLDRYGVTSTIPINDNQPLGSIVNVNAPMTNSDILTVLEKDRSVAFTPKSGKGSTVNQYQGYTNYALIRFAGSGNTYKYTNNTYTNRETTFVSQVNKGQITTYPYNVNTLSFNGNDTHITKPGGNYMQIGKTHEQYFQINMNTDDIVVWYCMSNETYDSTNLVYKTDTSSYYDDVPNDCVNAYYIYNKGNVTYSGVGHSSNVSLYTGTSIGQEYVNEAKLFVNTMIAAYQSAAQAPNIAIKKDARGTSDISDKYMLTDNTSVLSAELSATDESRAVYYRISDPNVGLSKTITVQYYVSDAAGGALDASVDATQKVSPLGITETYNTNGSAVTSLKGGYVYKFYLMNTAGSVSVLDQLKDTNIYSIKIYVKVTTMIGSTTLTPAVDSIEIKKQQLFELS